MREKSLKIVVGFHTTTDAIAMERYCLGHCIPGRLVPLPPVISAECGMCWASPSEHAATVEKALKDAALFHAGTWLLLL